MQGRQFSVGDVEVVSATVDLDEVESYRGGIASLQVCTSALADLLPVALLSSCRGGKMEGQGGQ